MTPAALSPALFSAPPSTAEASAGSSTAGNGQTPDNAFSSLLGSSDRPASQTPALGPAATGDSDEPLADTPVDVADAPWPPPGLETLIPLPVAVPPPAVPAAAALLAANRLLPAAGSDSLPGVGAGMPATAIALAGSATEGPALASALAPAAPPTAIALQAATEPLLDEDSVGRMLALNPTLTDTTVTPAVTDNGGLVALAALGASATASALPGNDGPGPLLPTAADFGGEQFDQDVAQGVEYMLDNKLQSARIRISPQQLGMIEVELRLEGERVHASFSSAQGEVRQALHDSLPRLREMLDAHGLQMGQTAVADSSASQHGQGGQPGHGQPGTVVGDSAPASAAAAGAVVWRADGLLDTYA